MSEEQATQLADTRPYLDTPLRVTIPVNVPVRVLAPSRDKSIYEDMYSPMAISAAKREGETLSSSYDHAYRDMANVQSPFLYKAKNAVSTGMVRNKNVSSEHEAMLKNSLKDYTVLAQSSRRAGKKDVEGQAYASLGVVFDNDEQYLLAIDYYLKYLSVSEELNDNMGIAAACNCIGVDYMTLANPNCESSITLSHLFAEQANLETLEYIHKAIDYHTRHLDVGPDAGGKLVAHINLGICLTWLGDINRAARHHQDALRIAIKMQTLYGQAIAVGNLGLLAMGKSDFSTSRTCFDQHLQLIQALMDAEAEINAWKLVRSLDYPYFRLICVKHQWLYL